MDRENEGRNELIELGTASVETKGSIGPALDVFTSQPLAGIVDDD